MSKSISENERVTYLSKLRKYFIVITSTESNELKVNCC